MSQPYVGQLLLIPYNFAPVGWMFCQGQLLPISENDVLFNLIGTTYGGDGETTFALPNLSGRSAIGMGQGPGLSSNYVIGETGGVESVTLSVNQMPSHSHATGCSSGTQNSNDPSGAVLATGPSVYDPSVPVGAALTPGSVSSQGGSQPHDNMQPYLTLNWIISLFGVFPSQG